MMELIFISLSLSLAYIAFSTMPQVAKRIKMFFALAPAVTVKFATGPFIKFSVFPEQVMKVCI